MAAFREQLLFCDLVPGLFKRSALLQFEFQTNDSCRSLARKGIRSPSNSRNEIYNDAIISQNASEP
jgi:hypothetical protein